MPFPQKRRILARVANMVGTGARGALGDFAEFSCDGTSEEDELGVRRLAELPNKLGQDSFTDEATSRPVSFRRAPDRCHRT